MQLQTGIQKREKATNQLTFYASNNKIMKLEDEGISSHGCNTREGNDQSYDTLLKPNAEFKFCTVCMEKLLYIPVYCTSWKIIVV